MPGHPSSQLARNARRVRGWQMWVIVVIFSLGSLQPASATLLTVPNPHAEVTNQRRANGNACGPACLINSLSYGSEKWQNVLVGQAGTNSRTRIYGLIARYGKQPSHHLQGNHPRWNPNAGINILDLTDIANEMNAGRWLPKIKNQILNRQARETNSQLLKRSHKLMVASMKKGYPPTISLSRYAYQHSQIVNKVTWSPVRSHFVMIYEIPTSLPRNATSFKVRYIDPWGGLLHTGTIHAQSNAFTQSPFLIADFPNTSAGKNLLKADTKTVLTLAGIIGAF
ncbi:hypothetical protein [Persicirhabdus sediminis]|uniref:Uncharacterized protein n=1 Tax=Persicirhabdus sediminis TaxID=454144 RepID=A0A8J7MDM1_9BACT|nr:hypothetical protein [Persicirhabdus sediminis]MBK1790702.1 hypothetical protein [Persicirhabdus sediminis]